MQRPTMDPTFLYDAPPLRPPKRSWLAWGRRLVRTIWSLMLASPFGRNRSFRNEDGTRLSRFVRTLTHRLAFAPILLVAFLVAIVVAATHPHRSDAGGDPLSFGVYYDPINFLADDGARLEAWLVPVIDARKVLEEKDHIVGKRYPAVVLVHDFTSSRQQLLPLVKPLHDCGFIVLALNLRGAVGLSSDAQTFGIREALDIKGAVDMLRRRTFVDADRIALVGVGTGANACLIAARTDPAIRAMALAWPVQNFDQAFAARVGDHVWLKPLHHLLRWTFEAMYGVDTSEIETHDLNKVIAQRHLLLADGRVRTIDATYVHGVQSFLRKQLTEQVAIAK